MTAARTRPPSYASGIPGNRTPKRRQISAVRSGSDLPERYAIEFQPERTAEICQAYGVRFPGLPED